MFHQPLAGCVAARLLAFISILLSSSSDRSTVIVVEGWLAPPCLSSSILSRRRHYCPIQHGGKQFTPIQQVPLHKNGIQMNHFSKTKRTRVTTAIHFGLEDIVFNAENAGFSLANTVLNPSSSSSGIVTTSSSATTTILTVLLSYISSIKSLLILYAAGVITSFSPCSLGLLPITISYISNAANERNDKNTMLPTLAYAAGLALVFTTLGVSASVLGGVFGSTGDSFGDGDSLIPYILATIGPLVSVLMGLQLLDFIRIPLPSLDFKWRSAVAFERTRGAATLGANNRNSGSLFDENGGLILGNTQSKNVSYETTNLNDGPPCEDELSNNSNEVAALARMFLLGGTSALVSSPCATPVLASLLAYLASVSSMSSSSGGDHSLGTISNGVLWMLSYTMGYSTLLLVAGATGGQAMVNLRKARDINGTTDGLWQWITPLTGGVLITFGMNGLLVALLGDPSLSALAPIIE